MYEALKNIIMGLREWLFINKCIWKCLLMKWNTRSKLFSPWTIVGKILIKPVISKDCGNMSVFLYSSLMNVFLNGRLY